MRVSELMTRHVEIAGCDDTIEKAAKLMAECDAGVLPVSEGDRLVGMITDRDIAVRGVAQGKSAQTKVRDVMTPDVRYCFEDEDIEQVAENMGQNQLRRLPVMNREKRLVGILSLGDIAAQGADRAAGEAMRNVAQPGGSHNQSSGGATRT
jgi:CBS domain-containing protein